MSHKLWRQLCHIQNYKMLVHVSQYFWICYASQSCTFARNTPCVRGTALGARAMSPWHPRISLRRVAPLPITPPASKAQTCIISSHSVEILFQHTLLQKKLSRHWKVANSSLGQSILQLATGTAQMRPFLVWGEPHDVMGVMLLFGLKEPWAHLVPTTIHPKACELGVITVHMLRSILILSKHTRAQFTFEKLHELNYARLYFMFPYCFFDRTLQMSFCPGHICEKKYQN